MVGDSTTWSESSDRSRVHGDEVGLDLRKEKRRKEKSDPETRRSERVLVETHLLHDLPDLPLPPPLCTLEHVSLPTVEVGLSTPRNQQRREPFRMTDSQHILERTELDVLDLLPRQQVGQVRTGSERSSTLVSTSSDSVVDLDGGSRSDGEETSLGEGGGSDLSTGGPLREGFRVVSRVPDFDGTVKTGCAEVATEGGGGGVDGDGGDGSEVSEESDVRGCEVGRPESHGT